jgi:multidrug efflux pump subunit AcrA (membrane-fusion protein)
MSRRLLTFIVFAVALAGGGTYYYLSHRTADAPAPITAAVTRGDVVAKVDATGTLAPVTTVQVGSQVSGTIKALHADYNSKVRKGEVVAELDPSLFQTQVDQARSTLIKAQADADRAKVEADDAATKARRAQELFDQKLIARNDLETAQATASQAQAAVKSARRMITQARAALNQSQVNLEHTIITRADRRHRHLAQRGRRPDGRREHVGADAVRHRAGPDAHAGQRQHRRIRHRAHRRRPAGDVPRGRVSRPRPSTAPSRRCGSTEDRAERRQLHDDDRRAEPDLKLKPGMTANVTVQTR